MLTAAHHEPKSGHSHDFLNVLTPTLAVLGNS